MAIPIAIRRPAGTLVRLVVEPVRGQGLDHPEKSSFSVFHRC